MTKRYRTKQQKAQDKVQPMTALPQHADAIGLDVGRAGFHISIPTPGMPPATWAVWYFDYQQNPDWYITLTGLCRPGTVIVAEPTGWHYLSPIANVIQRATKARLYLVDHQISGKVRAAHVSSQKTDQTDARALALIAQDIRERKPVRGVSYHDQELENYVIHLRLLVNSHARTTVEAARLKNRMRQLAHGMFPSLSEGTMWFTCLKYGKASPSQIRAWLSGERPTDITPTNWVRLQKFGALLPEYEITSEIVAATALELYERLATLQESVTRLEAQVEQIVTNYPFDVITRRWMTVPYANPMYIAPLHVATHGKADQMETEQFKACLGAFPQVKSSGLTHQSRAHKKGYRPAMNTLFLWTLSLVRSTAPDNPIKSYFAGGEKQGGKKFTAARSKLARILAAVARSENGYDPSMMKGNDAP